MEPGVYIDLPFDDYLKVDALGSSDLKKLLRGAANWWYGSKHNLYLSPRKLEKHFIMGSAMHAFVLEGEDAFYENFSVEPDIRDYPDAAKTVKEIRHLFDLRGIPYKKSFLKADLIEVAADAGLEGRVWDCITAAHKEEVAGGKSPLTANDFRGIEHSSALINNHPDLKDGLKMGLSEVSVFWYRDGEDDILWRARFDRMAPAFSLDLKTMSNWQGLNPVHAMTRQIVEHEYDIQATLYHEARHELRKAVADGRVYTCSEDKPQKPLDEIERRIHAIAEADTWKWIWLFQQLRDDTGANPKAPICIPRFYTPSSIEEQQSAIESGSFDMMAQANLKIEAAIANYRSYRDTIGFETPWIQIEPLTNISDEDLAAAGLNFKGVPRT